MASILDIAREIRPMLPELLGERAGAVDQALAKLLERAEAGENVDYEIRVLLGEHEATDNWKRDRLQENGSGRVSKGFSPLPGYTTNTPNVVRYVCPVAGCSSEPWFPIDVADTNVPSCEIHKVPFKLASNG